LRNGQATEEEQVRVSRITVVVISLVSITLGILAMDQNVAFLVSLAFCIAASANLPTILYSLYWKKFNTTGAVASLWVGLGVALILIFFSPAVSGAESAMFPNVDFSWFPLTNPGLVSIPAGFIAGIVGTYRGKGDEDPKLQYEMEVRSLTGVGVEAPVDHKATPLGSSPWISPATWSTVAGQHPRRIWLVPEAAGVPCIMSGRARRVRSHSPSSSVDRARLS